MWGETKKQAVAEDDKFTFLGKGTNFKGIVTFDGTVRIDGRVEGEVHTGGAVIVGESAIIKGVIAAGSVSISGRVKGTVTASQKVELQKPGILIGDIQSPMIAVEEGAHFHGMSNMGAEKWVEDEGADLASPQDPGVHDLVAHRGKVKTQEP
ncbi:MAG: Polymer-forming bactofilin [Nitrospira sp.]|jgi:cytoskeletal protein CcmA (bactofilin family)|nr:MAG: Polymer-forming bactofilin [Nitrospira sp.]